MKQVDFYCRSGDDHWQHEEYDAGGQLVARYASWRRLRTSQLKASASGWRKLSPAGQLLAQGDDLPL